MSNKATSGSRKGSNRKPSRAAPRTAAQSSPRGTDDESTPSVELLPPLKPQPKLLAILSVALGLWVAFLLILYFVTVFRRPH